MKTIHKYELEITDNQAIAINGLIAVLSVKEQFDNVVMYVMVDTDRIFTGEVEIAMIGTGNPCEQLNYEMKNGMEFLGTVKTSNGELMWHIFYKIDRG